MSHSLYLLTAALLAAQGPEGRLTAVPADGEVVEMISGPVQGGYGWQPVGQSHWQNGGMAEESWGQNRGGLLSRIGERLGSLFTRQQHQGRPQYWNGNGAGRTSGYVASPVSGVPQGRFIEQAPQTYRDPATEPPLADAPSVTPPAGVPVSSNPTSTPATGTVNAPIRQHYLEKVGHDADYKEITGQLYYVAGEQGAWVVRYGDADDQYGGSVVLSTAVNMSDFRQGDLIAVRGEILNEGVAQTLGAPLFRVQSVELVEHAD